MRAIPGSPAADAVERAREILSDASWQTDLPDGEQLGLPLSLGRGAALVIWIALGLAVLAFAVWLASRLRRSGRFVKIPAVRAASAGVERERSSAAEADRLASEGRWDEAVHGLLQAAIEDEARRIDRPPRRSSTSRELVRAFPWGETRREAFRVLVEHVERSLFGGETLSEADWRRCRERYDVLAGRTS
jgi:hypothetical protein